MLTIEDLRVGTVMYVTDRGEITAAIINYIDGDCINYSLVTIPYTKDIDARVGELYNYVDVYTRMFENDS